MPQILQPPSSNAIREELKKLVLANLLGPSGGPEEEVAECRVLDRLKEAADAICWDRGRCETRRTRSPCLPQYS
jgi:hypothetical protein